MSLQTAARGSVLRMHRGAIPRPTGVTSVQNQLRRLCLSANSSPTRPQIQTALSTSSVAQWKSFATDTKKPNAKTTKAATGKRANSSSTKKKPLTEKQQEAKKLKEQKDHIKQLKATALAPPKKLSPTFQGVAMQVKLAEIKGQHAQAKDAFSAAAGLVKSLGSYEREQLQAKAEENKVTNAAAYDSFIKSHTPLEIREANIARRALSRLLDANWPPLTDDRLVKKPMTAYTLYLTERLNSGAFEGKPMQERFKDISQEWKDVPDSKKQQFQKLQQEDRARYVREHEEVYGAPPQHAQDES